jgi:hypothetical protein
MKALMNLAPTNVVRISEKDPNAGGGYHAYAIQYGGPKDVLHIPFQHGPRGAPTSTAGIFDDDLLAILEDRMQAFEEGPFACEENALALAHIRDARYWLGTRVARRVAQGVLGANAPHATTPATEEKNP